MYELFVIFPHLGPTFERNIENDDDVIGAFFINKDNLCLLIIISLTINIDLRQKHKVIKMNEFDANNQFPTS